MKKIIIGVIAVVAVVAVAGAYYFPKNVKQVSLGASTAGSTFSNAKFYGTAIALSSATSTAILNTDANDRYITDVRVGCESLGTSKQPIVGGSGINSLSFTVATSSSAVAVPPLSVWAAVALNSAISTSSQWFVSATTTIQNQTGALATSSIANTWPTGSYLNFWFNATNTAACTIGVDTVAS